MKKIFVPIAIFILFFSFWNLVKAEGICDDAMQYTDAAGGTGDADSWCAVSGLFGCNDENCGNDIYHFCKDGKHYTFGCKCNFWGACNCDPGKTSVEECGECVSWTCNQEGCSGGSCGRISCPHECCPIGDPKYTEKSCPLEGQVCGVDNECISKSCPWECCNGDLGYVNKLCREGYYCSEGHVCKEQEEELEECPWDCCISEEGYQNKLCPEGKECVGHECDGGGDGDGNGNGNGNGNGGALGPVSIDLENPLEAETFEDLVEGIINFVFMLALAIVPLMVIIGALYLITAGGNPARVDTGKKIIFFAMLGFAIILLAKGLIALLKNVLGVKETETMIPLFFSSLSLNLRLFISNISKRSNKFNHFIKRFL
jgi:hypothetical protein